MKLNLRPVFMGISYHFPQKIYSYQKGSAVIRLIFFPHNKQVNDMPTIVFTFIRKPDKIIVTTFR
jgi:hypothetical protein